MCIAGLVIGLLAIVAGLIWNARNYRWYLIGQASAYGLAPLLHPMVLLPSIYWSAADPRSHEARRSAAIMVAFFLAGTLVILMVPTC